MRKRTNRRVYALVNPIRHAIEGCAVTDGALIGKLQLQELSALDAFQRGLATEDDLAALDGVRRVAQTMAEDFGIGPEVLLVCQRAHAALQTADGRRERLGKAGRAAGEYEALADLCQYHDLQRASVPRALLEKALQRAVVRRREERARERQTA